MTDRRYSNSMFQEALQAYKKAVAIPTKNFVSQFHMEKTSLLMFDIIQIKNLSDIDAQISKFEEVSEKVNTYLRDLSKEKSENKNNIALEKITSVVWNAKCQIDQEIMMLKMDKLSAVEQKPQELNVQQQKDQHLKKVVEEYLEWRDQNDNNKAMSLYDILAWPFRKIRDWLKRFKI
ncbi:hypothetical protein EGW08_009732 [Elysia chlorotica]|uniref:Uncharacterized protein n=1 Tax=Elysia chlorotica TaxID=188477 RepID=A0A3S0ZTN3_ELYCH|nr:hypothetical protein EGW08_009732 [Elysia chlorotica]